MKYKCKDCQRIFVSVDEADNHEGKTGHHVELNVVRTYWGEHLIAQ